MNIKLLRCSKLTYIAGVSPLYAHIDYKHDKTEKSYSDSKGPFDWSKQRMSKLMQLKQQVLEKARRLVNVPKKILR